MKRVSSAWMCGFVIVLALGCGSSNGEHNQPPLAAAGSDVNVKTGDSVTLDGSASTDPDGDPITYHWTLVARPAGSNATITDPSSPQPLFVPDMDGGYQFELVVNDGRMDSSVDAVVIAATTPNTPPNARAGHDAQVPFGSVVQLDGSQSSDPDGDALTYLWSFRSLPEGSTAGIKDPTEARTLFVADKVGRYEVDLTVSDGQATSQPNTVVLTSVDDNVKPVADAGPDVDVSKGSVVNIDGVGSFDADGDTLTYEWSFVSKPAGSTAGIKDPFGRRTLFVADQPGIFVVSLVVSDGRLVSEPDQLTVTAAIENVPPIAKAGADKNVIVGSQVTLDGTGSTDPDGNNVNFHWSFAQKPAGSNAQLSSEAAERPTFTADQLGTFAVQLIVDDGQAASEPDIVVITSSTDGGGGGGGSCSGTGAILCDPLNGSTSGAQDGGSFTGGGWTPGFNIRWDLGQTLSTGAFSADLDNWDPSENSPQHQYDKQDILDLFQDGSGDTHRADDTNTAFITVRTGSNYNGLFKFASTPHGFGERIETRLSPPGGRVDPSRTHTVRIEWSGGSASVFLDGGKLTTQTHSSSMPLRYVFVGSDNSGGGYGPQKGVIYSNVAVWGSTGGGKLVNLKLSMLDGSVREIESAENPLTRRGLLDWFRSAKLPPFAAAMSAAPVPPR